MEQLVSSNVPVGTALASETRENFTIFTNPLVQLPPAADASMNLLLEGHVARISPCYKGRNGSLLSIGQKGRFLLMVNAEK